MKPALLNILRTSKVFAVVLGLHLFILSLLLFHPGCQSTPTPVAPPAPMGEITALDNATLADPTRPLNYTDTIDDSDTQIADQPDIDSSINASAAVDAPVQKTYTVVKGDSLWSIAHKNAVSINELLELNGFSRNSVIHPGDEIKLPAAPSETAAPADLPTADTKGLSYTVKSGDTLAQIARSHAVSVRELKAFNHLSSDLIRVGQSLKIPAEGDVSVAPAPVQPPAPAAEVSVPADGDYAIHVVAPGEFPGKIAHHYGMKTAQLLAINHISDPRKLRVGQQLKVIAGNEQPSQPEPAAEQTPSEPEDSAPPSVAALEAMTADSVEQTAPVVEIEPAATLE